MGRPSTPGVYWGFPQLASASRAGNPLDSSLQGPMEVLLQRLEACFKCPLTCWLTSSICLALMLIVWCSLAIWASQFNILVSLGILRNQKIHFTRVLVMRLPEEYCDPNNFLQPNYMNKFGILDLDISVHLKKAGVVIWKWWSRVSVPRR